MKKLINKIGAGISVLPVLLMPSSVFAAASPTGGLTGAQDTLRGISDEAGDPTRLPRLVGGFINAFLGVLGIIFVILVVYAGILYMTAAGDDSKVKKAKALLIQAVIGIIIIVSAYAISSFVIQALITATSTS